MAPAAEGWGKAMPPLCPGWGIHLPSPEAAQVSAGPWLSCLPKSIAGKCSCCGQMHGSLLSLQLQ